MRNIIIALVLVFLFTISCSKKDLELIEATKQGNLDLVEQLIKQGADVNAEDEDGNTALLYASENGDIKLIRLLISSGAYVNANADNKYSRAYDLINALLKEATESCDLEKVRKLLNQGANVNVKNYHETTALDVAIAKCHIDLVKLLIQAGALVNDADDEALMRALQIGLLMETNEVFAFRPDIAKLLILAGADVNAKDKDGRTALFYTTAWKHDFDDITKLLLEVGADPLIIDNNGKTALDYTIERGYENTIKILREYMQFNTIIIKKLIYSSYLTEKYDINISSY